MWPMGFLLCILKRSFSYSKCVSKLVYILIMFILQGVEDYGMLRNGDRVLVCLSGGKDSLSLLHTIRQYQFYSRAKVCTVNSYYGISFNR